MSKLIVEMEMPQAWPCDLIGIGYAMCCSAANSKKRIVEYDECVKNGTKPDWCPICGVLPDEHGDLIDRDEAFDDVKRFICNGCNFASEDDCLACIVNGVKDILCGIKPTIAAERKDDEQIH